ncbi:MAG TPA: response regulator [Gemmatimonadaceae bacterium]|nr:response regulator [Gemmatimonadaceae bacterium]
MPPDAPRLVVLLVDDDPLQTERVRAALAAPRAGSSPELGVAFTLVAVARPADAIARLDAGGVDVIVLDLTPSDPGALASIEALRGRALSAPVIVRGPHADQAVALAAVRAGAHDYVDMGDAATAALAHVLLAAVERSRAEAERHGRFPMEPGTRGRAEAESRRAAFLADASAALEDILDYGVLIARVPNLAVPTLADACFLDLRDADGHLGRAAWTHHVPRQAALIRETERRAPAHPTRAVALARALEVGDAGLVDARDADALARLASDPEHLELLRALAPRAAYIVPLVARGEVLGALTFMNTEPGRDFTPADLALADELTARAGRALANARLYDTARAELAERRRTEARLRAFVDGAPYGIFRATPDGQFLEANPAFARTLGYADARELMSALRADRLGDPELPARLAAAARQPLDPFDSAWHRRDGAAVRVRVELRPAAGDRGAPEVEGFVVDVTPLHAAQDALRRAERLATVGQIVSGVAHELNNPLAAILLSAENLLQDVPAGADVDSLQVIREQAQRARAVVRDLRAVIFHPDARRAPVWLANAAESVAARLAAQADREGVTLRRETRGAALPVLADPPAIEQAIAHLVVNAIQAARGGTVRIVVDGDGVDCTLVVEDDGSGIPPEHLARVFEPFFSTRSDATIGARGLGLPIALGIIEQCGGTLVAENRGGGERGARFTVRIPAYHAEAAPDGRARAAAIARAALGPSPARPASTRAAVATAGAPRAASGAAPDGAGRGMPPRRVLVVDDELAIRTALRRFFARRHWEVEEAENGEVALARLLADGGDSRYALVISDLKMPGLTGIELHDRLLALRPRLLDRLILSTGDTASGEVVEFVERTRCRVLQKPFELSVIAQVADTLAALPA